MSLTYFLNDLEMVPVAAIITGIALVFTYHMRCVYIMRSLYFKIFSAYYYYYYYYYYYCALFQVLFVIFIWCLTARNSVCCFGRTGFLWLAADCNSKFTPPRNNFAPEDNFTCLLNHLVFSKCTYSEWLIMRFPARPEISLFIAKAMPALAHTHFSFHLGA